MKVWTISLIFLTLIISCGEKETADLVLLNGKIYTVNATNEVVEAVAVKDGKIWKVGGNDEISELIGEATQEIDLETFEGSI